MNWFRVYDDIIDDPKVLQLSLEFRWLFIGLLAISSRQIVRGSLPDETQIGIHLRLSKPKLQRMIEFFKSSGLIEEDMTTKQLRIHGWEKRQFESDDITKRTKRSKERAKERSQERSGEHDGNILRALGERSVSAQKEKENGSPYSLSSFPPTPPLLALSVTPSEKKEKNAPAEPALFPLPDWISREDWEGWLEMRKANRVKTTIRAMKIALGKLTKLRAAGQNISEILQEAILRNWTGMWGIDDPRKSFNGKPLSKAKPPEPIVTREQQAKADAMIAEGERLIEEARLKRIQQQKANA